MSSSEKKDNAPERARSMEVTDVIELEENRNGQFHRSFTPRQVHVILLGSNIGSGLFIATGKALANGGPGSMVIAYGIVCSALWMVLQALSEMTIAFPVSGNFVDYADRWVDPALAFGAGFAEWLGWTAVIGAEATFFDVLLQLWTGGDFPVAASLTIFLVACLAIFLLPNKWFAWFEYVTSLIKILMFLLIIAVSLAITLGAGPNGSLHDGSTWTDLPVFKNGFASQGFANSALLALWAVSDQVFIGIIGGEAQNPRYSMAHAAKLVPFRVNIIYMVSIVFITVLIPSDDDRLLGGSGIAASPFVIAITDAGIKGLPDLLNTGMICGLLAIASESVYVASRILRTMSHQKLIPEAFAKVDDQGRPRLSLIITCVVGTFLTYINLSNGGKVGFTWLLSITSASFFSVWFIIALTNYRFRQAVEAQNDHLFSEEYAWTSSWWPAAPLWTATVAMLLFVCCIYAAVDPVDGSEFTAYNFFQYLIGLIIIVVFTIVFKLVKRSPWRDPQSVDLITGRRRLTVEDMAQLDHYYRLSRWRRFLTYVQLW
ncbi:AA-permease domain-containing protein [Fusarium sp. Ph1]|nr:AA-permease domain-containing protein [Fusarium sp. Ph1]